MTITTFLRMPALVARTGLSRAELYNRIRAGTFPAPVPLGPRTNAWDEREIATWQEKMIAERDAGRAA